MGWVFFGIYLIDRWGERESKHEWRRGRERERERIPSRLCAISTEGLAHTNSEVVT